ncbi:6-phosphogluconolactonase [Pyrenophora seminiperda CCB06]|uniref:6-phosphogluconolactonase n=1 Tax=Pyrenophora seminiperda CCB06 TaxID=1302712 RepID=A0A3M7MAZ9_9PLEO|nr:6-phosphogluconolactonase [Pyrenophora seminiperda CCB06]
MYRFAMLSSHPLLLPLFGTVASAANLWASHYSGTINYLTFSGNNLALSSSSSTGNRLPSWLTYDDAGKGLYISDENFYGSSGGTLTSWSIGNNGSMKSAGTVPTPQGVVATALYGGSDGKSFVANAHYQTSQLTTYKLPLNGGQPMQTIKYTGKSVNPYRQEASHPHHAFVDPTGDFLVVPDLGADLIRIHKINKQSGALTDCTPAKPAPGTGPRHGVFWSPAGSSRVRRQGGTTLFIANELSNSVSSWAVSYASGGCMSLSLKQTLTPYQGNATAVSGTKVGEIRAKGNFLYNSNRNDKKFSGNDSITQYTISSTGTLTWTDTTSSYGTYPRTFDISKEGGFVAVGDQTTSNVAIVARDTTTGKLGKLVASLRIGAAGTPENEDGLSAVLWAN